MPRLMPINSDPREAGRPLRAEEANRVRLTAKGARLVYAVGAYRRVSVHLRPVPDEADMTAAVYRVRQSNFPTGANAMDYAEAVEFSGAGGFVELDVCAEYLVIEQTGIGSGSGEPHGEFAVFGGDLVRE